MTAPAPVFGRQGPEQYPSQLQEIQVRIMRVLAGYPQATTGYLGKEREE